MAGVSSSCGFPAVETVLLKRRYYPGMGVSVHLFEYMKILKHEYLKHKICSIIRNA